MYFLLPLAVIPVIFIFYYVYKKDHKNPEPWKLLWVTFFFGALFLLPAAFLEVGLTEATGLSEKGQTASVFAYAVLIVGLVEELSKFLAIRIYVYRKVEFDELIDGLVYGAASGAGFAVVENIYYVLEYGFAVGVMRAFLAVPLHIFTGTLLGYGLIQRRLSGSLRWLLILFPSSVLLHGLYDFMLFTTDEQHLGNIGIAILSVIGLVVFARYLLKKHGTEELAQNVKMPVFVKFLYRALGVLFILFGLFMLLGFFASTDSKDSAVFVASIVGVPLLSGAFLFWKSLKKDPTQLPAG